MRRSGVQLAFRLPRLNRSLAHLAPRLSSDPDRPGSITLQTIGPFFEAIGIEDMDSDIAVYLVSHELKSESLGDLSLKGWLEGWGMLKSVTCTRRVELASATNELLITQRGSSFSYTCAAGLTRSRACQTSSRFCVRSFYRTQNTSRTCTSASSSSARPRGLRFFVRPIVVDIVLSASD